jgi:Endonuclease/Exonuclease/phosphatase family 2
VQEKITFNEKIAELALSSLSFPEFHMRQRAENRATASHSPLSAVLVERSAQIGLQRPGSAGGWVTATVRSPAGSAVLTEEAQFEAHSLTRSGKNAKKLSVCRSTGVLDVYDVRRQTHESLNAREIMKVRKSDVNDRKLKLFFSHVANPEKYVFPSKAHRDRFYRLVLSVRFPPRTPVALGAAAAPTDGPPLSVAASSSAAASASISRKRAGSSPLLARGHAATVFEPSVGEKHPISVFVGTWNVGNAAPSDLTPWLESGHDIYAVSVQECEYAPRTGYSNCESDIFAAIQSAVGPGYVQLEGLSLLYIRLIVLVKREHYYRVTNLHKGKEATGIANIIGNKGGAAVAFNFNETRLCFVGCHLAAHLEKVADRNANYADIVRGLRLPKEMDLLNYYDHLFWCGDLNYRLDMARDDAIALIDKQDWAALRQNDQLIEEMREKRCFVGFREAEVNFRPTYRYNRGDRTYSEEVGFIFGGREGERKRRRRRRRTGKGKRKEDE